MSFAVPPAIAGEYVLIKGKGVEVCEEYGKNLNSFNLHNKYVMACERKINPEFTDFKKPEWVVVDLWENRKILEKIARFLGERHPISSKKVGKEPHYSYSDFQEWEGQLRNMIEGKYAPTVEEVQIDIDNDVNKENIIKYSDGNCPGGNYFGAALIVLNDNKSEIDIEKTKQLLQNPQYYPKLPNELLSRGWEFSMYDVFLYKGKSYFNRWSGNQAPGSKDKIDILKVFVTETNKAKKVSTKEICRYRFKSAK